MLDLDKAMLDPDSVFSAPEDVLGVDELSTDQKIRILEQWDYDAREMSTAEAENMAGGEDCSELITRIHECLAKLKSE